MGIFKNDKGEKQTIWNEAYIHYFNHTTYTKQFISHESITLGWRYMDLGGGGGRGRQLPCLHSAPIPGSNPRRWVRAFLQGFIDPRLHSDPAHGADPTRGAEWMSSSMKFCVLHVEKFHTLGGGGARDPGFLFTNKNNAVSDPTCGVEPYKFRIRGAQKAGQTRKWGRWFAFILRGKRRVWSRIWGSTPQSEHCVNAVNITLQSQNDLHCRKSWDLAGGMTKWNCSSKTTNSCDHVYQLVQYKKSVIPCAPCRGTGAQTFCSDMHWKWNKHYIFL